MAGGDGVAQEATPGQQVLLAQDPIQALRAHPLCQGGGADADLLDPVLEEVS